MSLSTQLARGRLALPMLLTFVLLGVAAGQGVEPDPAPVAKVEPLSELCSVRDKRSRVLVLAQAPADLGNLAIRWSLPCRA